MASPNGGRSCYQVLFLFNLLPHRLEVTTLLVLVSEQNDPDRIGRVAGLLGPNPVMPHVSGLTETDLYALAHPLASPITRGLTGTTLGLSSVMQPPGKPAKDLLVV